MYSTHPTKQHILSKPARKHRHRRSSAVLSLLAEQYRTVFWLIAIGLGFLQAWEGRYVVNPDGIAYLDIGDAYWRGDWQSAINAYWSPLYSWLLGGAMVLLKPSAYWEFPVVHLVNFIIYLGALACFDLFFMRRVIAYNGRLADVEKLSDLGRLPAWFWSVLGYALFLWSTLSMMTPVDTSPDMCVAGAVYVAAGLLVQMREGQAGWLTFALLGLVLGCGYLAKTVMFPLTFVFLLVSLVVAGGELRAKLSVTLALAVFLLIAGPFIAAISSAKGQLTFGDSGKLNHAWSVSDAKKSMRNKLDAPVVNVFGDNGWSTHPIWIDPSQRNDPTTFLFNPLRQLKGVYDPLTFRFNPLQQIKRVMVNAKFFHHFLYSLEGSLLLGLAVLFYLYVLFYISHRGWAIAKDIADQWFLLVPAGAALGMYLLIFVQTRYIAPFMVLLCIGLLSSVRLPRTQQSHRLVTSAVIISLTALCLSVSPPMGRALLNLMSGREAVSATHWRVAEGLQRMGVQQGDKVAAIGDAKTAYWARLARVRTVAEVPPADVDSFWSSEASVKEQVLQTIAKAGACVVVAEKVPEWAAIDGWQRVENTNCYVYFFQPPQS